jgi:hypothetical protein
MRVKDAPRAPACSPAVDTYCGFLSLPTELRCHIYDYLLAEPHAITISAGYTTIFGHRICDKARKIDVPGLPLDFAPLVRNNHDAALLSAATPPEVALDKEDAWTGGKPQLQLPGPLALLRTCRMVNDELKDYMRGRKARKAARAKDATTPSDDTEGLSLYVSYPHGVLVLNHLYPSLLKQARRVYISGYYTNAKESDLPLNASLDSAADLSLTPQSSLAATPVRSMYHATANPTPRLRSSRTRLRLDPPLQRQTSPTKSPTTFPAFDKTTSSTALCALADTLRVLFPSTPAPTPSESKPSQLASLQARILYPGPDSYSSVWSDESSPVSHLLRGICGGKIDMQVKRGSLGCGVSVGVAPQPQKRVVSTSWENWRVVEQAPAGLNGRRLTGRGREVRLSDLDQFLIEV